MNSNVNIIDNKKYINNLIDRIVNLLVKGEKIEMKNKLDFELTLEETKGILSHNIDYFSEINNQNSHFFEIRKKLYEKLNDLEEKLSKLSLIIFCRAKAEKYLENSRKDLGYINMVLLSILNNSTTLKHTPAPIEKIEDIDDSNKIEYDRKIKELSVEVEELKRLLKEKQKPTVVLEKQQTSTIKLIKLDTVDLQKNAEMYAFDGIKYYYGIDSSINYYKAWESFSQSAVVSNPVAMYMIAKMYHNGQYIEKNIKKALAMYKEASNKGHSNSSLQLASLAEEGKLCDSDRAVLKDEELSNFEKYKLKYIEVSFKYISLAAYEQNSSEAYFILGQIYQFGTHGQSKNYEKSYEMYKKSVEIDNNPFAVNAIGNIYYIGEIIEERNCQKAFDKYKYASKAGCIDALNSLGVCYEKGHGIEKDLKYAYDIYTHASNENHPSAMANKAICLINKNYNNDKLIYKEAFNLLTHSILLLSENNKSAFYYLGYLYQNGYQGKNQPPDDINAFRMYKKAMKRGHINAQTKVGLYLIKGIKNYIEKDEERGVQLLNNAADRNDLEAANILSNLYEYGNEYLEKNLDKSKYYNSICQSKAKTQSNLNIGTLLSKNFDKREYNYTTSDKDLSITLNKIPNNSIINPEDKITDLNKSILMNFSRSQSRKLQSIVN